MISQISTCFLPEDCAELNINKQQITYPLKDFLIIEALSLLNAIKNCQVLVKNLNLVAGMTRRFVSAKRLIRYFSNSSKLVEHRAQSPVREVKMLAVWPSIAEGFPTAKFTSYMQ